VGSPASVGRPDFTHALAEYDDSVAPPPADGAAAVPPSDDRKKQLLRLIKRAMAEPGPDFVCTVLVRIDRMDADLARVAGQETVRRQFAKYRTDLLAAHPAPCPGPEEAPSPESPTASLTGPATTQAPDTSEPAVPASAPTQASGAGDPGMSASGSTRTQAPSASEPASAPPGPAPGGVSGLSASVRRASLRKSYVTGGAAGLVVGITGLGLAIAGAVNVRQLERMSRDYGEIIWDDYTAAGDRWEDMAIAGAIVGGVGIVTGVALLALAGRRPQGRVVARPWRWTGTEVRIAF
jgi:hypothetical protein